MSLSEIKSQTTPEFISLAEQAAMNKVLDIHEERALKHGFVRFGPLTIEENFQDHIRNNKDHADPSIDRLKGILRLGLVSGNFAKRARIPISRNWLDPNNDYNISLTTNYPIDAFDIAIIAATHNVRFSTKIPREHIFSLIISGDVIKGVLPKNPYEVLIKHRIRPRFFKGIVFLDEVKPFPHNIDYTSSSPIQTGQMTMNAIMETLSKPDRAIPVYGISGSLYWPRQMSYQEVQGFVRERRNSAI